MTFCIDLVSRTCRFQYDIHARRVQKRLVDGTSVGNFEKALAMITGQGDRQMESKCDFTDTMRLLSHRPLGVDREALGGKTVPDTEPGREVRHAPGKRPDEQLDWTHPGIRSPVLDRLIGDHGVTTGCDIEPRVAAAQGNV